jgi:hypothetical protein
MRPTQTPLAALALALALALSACNSTPQDPEFSDSDVIMDRLHLVTNARVGMAYVDPDVDLADFNSIMIDTLDLSNVEVVQPNNNSVSTARRTTWELTDRDRESLQNAFKEVFERELAETGDYGVVSEVGPNVLRLSAAITQIAPSATRDDGRSRHVGRTRVYTEGAGNMTMAFALSDSQTGEVFAIVKDTRSGSPVWGLNNSVSNMGDVRFMFNRWARMLRARMDIAHGY